MTLPPYDRPASEPVGMPAPGWGRAYPAAGPPWAPAGPPAGARRSRRGLVVAAALTGVFVLGGAGIAVASYLSGGGQQPEDVLPADTLGLVKVDLDPAAGQKLALMSLLDRFPGLDTEGPGDVRGRLLQPLLDLSDGGLDYAADVEPWLGDRIAVAALPAEGSADGVVPVLALAVTDEARMTEALTRAQGDTTFGFAVRDDYVLITDSQERAQHVAAAEATLADDADFAGDREALGGDQIALAWGDLSAGESILAAHGAVPEGTSGEQQLTGRVILGVHAQDDALELVGLDFGVSDVGTPSREPTRLAQDLPEDTLAAVSASGLGDQVATMWNDVQESGVLAGVEEPFTDLGLPLPEDLRTMLGTDLLVAAFGDPNSPTFGARVVTDEPEEAARLLDGVLSTSDLDLPIYSFGERDFVVATDSGTADALAADGRLGDTDAFRATVADADAASVIGYVDLAAVVDQVVAQGGATGEEAAKYSAAQALGFSVTSTDEGSRFVLRITTR